MKQMKVSDARTRIATILHEESCVHAEIDFIYGEFEVRGEVYSHAIVRIAKFLKADTLFRLTERGTIRFLSGYDLVQGGESVNG